MGMILNLKKLTRMKKLLLFLFFPFWLFSQIPNTTPNASGDDTAGIQAWLNGGSGTPIAGATYVITSQMNVTATGNYVRNGNGMILLGSGEYNLMINVDKPDGLPIKLENMVLDGNNIVDEGLNVNSYMNAENMEIKNFHSTTDNAIGIRIEITNDATKFGDYLFKDIDMSNIDSPGNGIIGDGNGASRMVLHRWQYNQSGTTITFDGGTWDGAWGDDGDIIQTEDNQQTDPNNSYLIFKNIYFGGFTRRHAKVTSGNTEFYDCQFVCPSATHPKVINHTNFVGGLFTANSTSAGMVGDGSSNPGNGHKYIRCTFDGTIGNAQSRRMGVNKTTGLEIRDCIFIDYDIDINLYSSGQNADNVDICNTSFDSQSRVLGGGGPGTLADGAVGFGNITGTGYNQLPASKWYVKTDCPPPGSGSGTVNVTGITLNSPSSQTLEIGEQVAESVTIAPANASNQTVTTSSSNTSVLSDSGEALAAGTAIYTITTVDGGFDVDISVTVNAEVNAASSTGILTARRRSF